MLLDRDMPVLNGIEVLRIVRSPGVFPRPNLPVIMLTTRAQRIQVNEPLRPGANEFLLKPTSPKALCDRLMSIVFKPRPKVKVGTFYVPQPRRGRAHKSANSNLDGRQSQRPRRWRARDDSNVRPLPSEGNALSS